MLDDNAQEWGFLSAEHPTWQKRGLGCKASSCGRRDVRLVLQMRASVTLRRSEAPPAACIQQGQSELCVRISWKACGGLCRHGQHHAYEPAEHGPLARAHSLSCLQLPMISIAWLM